MFLVVQELFANLSPVHHRTGCMQDYSVNLPGGVVVNWQISIWHRLW